MEFFTKAISIKEKERTVSGTTGWSAPPSTAFFCGIPYMAAVIICATIAVIFHKKTLRKDSSYSDNP